MSLSILCSTLYAQEINFDDLKRQGRPLSKTVVIQGIATEAGNLLSQIEQADGNLNASRESSMRDSAQRYEAGGVGGQGQFTCTFRCQVGGLGEIKGPFTYKFSGATRTQARDELKKNADSLCRRLRGDGLVFRNQTMSTRDENCE